MKRIFLNSILLITLLFVLTGCSNTETLTVSNNDEIISEELELNGTGKISLKELVDSPKLATKTWYELNMNDIKTYYGVNADDQYNTKKVNSEEISAYFSNDGMSSTTQDGVTIEVKNEYISLDNYNNSRISLFSVDVPYNNDFPENLNIKSLNFSLGLDSSLTSEQLNETFNKSSLFIPYLKEHNCKNIEDIAIALGFEETDKSMLEAIRNNIEYYADYESDFGNVSIASLPSEDMDSHQLTISFEDENCWLKSIDINYMVGMNGDTKFEELQVNYTKNLD